MTPLSLLAASVLTGVLPDGRPYVLTVDAQATTDIRLHDDTLRFVTTGGVLGEVDREAMEVVDLLVPEVPYRGFVQDAPGWWVFDDAHRIVALDADGAVERVLRAYPDEVKEAWWDGEQLHAVTHQPLPPLREETSGMRLVRRPEFLIHWWAGDTPRLLPASTAWHLRDGAMWWGDARGSVHGEIGVLPGGQRRHLAAKDFVEIDGELVAYGGGVSWMWATAQWATLPGGRTQSSGYNPMDLPHPDPYTEPAVLLWMGTVDGQVTALDARGWLFRDGFEGAPAEPLLPPWSYRAERTVRSAVDGDTTWLTDGLRGVLRLDSDTVSVVTAPTVPSVVDVRFRHGDVWLVRGPTTWRRSGPVGAPGGYWVRYDAESPVGQNVYVPHTVTTHGGPVWVVDTLVGSGNGLWLAGPSEGALLIPNPMGWGIQLTDSPYGPYQQVSRAESCLKLDMPCAKRTPYDPAPHPASIDAPTVWDRLPTQDRDAIDGLCRHVHDGGVIDSLNDRRGERNDHPRAPCAMDAKDTVWRGGRTLERWQGGQFEPVDGLPHLGDIYAVVPAQDGIVVSSAMGTLLVGPRP